MLKLENKKGQGVQFNWIYVVVAGAIILGFFSWFIVRYIDLQNTKIDAKVARNIDSNFLAIKGASQFKPVLDLGENFNFNFACDSLTVNSKYMQKINDKIIFSNKEIFNTRKINVWTYGFETGFFVDNLVYVIDPRQKYHLVYGINKDFVQGVYDKIPQTILNQVTLSDYSGVLSELSGKDRFILFFEPSLDQLESLKSKGSVIYIEPKEVGQVTFYQDDTKTLSSFLGYGLIYGLIFSDDIKMYDCSKKRALDKVGVISDIYYTKTRSLDRISGNAFCDYNTLSGLLKTFSESSKNDDILGISKYIGLLVSENKRLYDLGCKGVF